MLPGLTMRGVITYRGPHNIPLPHNTAGESHAARAV